MTKISARYARRQIKAASKHPDRSKRLTIAGMYDALKESFTGEVENDLFFAYPTFANWANGGGSSKVKERHYVEAINILRQRGLVK